MSLDEVEGVKDMLEIIHDEMGEKVMRIWIDTGLRFAEYDKIAAYNIPTYLSDYICLRYEGYKRGDDNGS